jgi:hypothetical protein
VQEISFCRWLLRPRGLRCVVAALFVCLLPAAAWAQGSVPYVPTPQDVVERMLQMAKVGPHDYLIDLGSGDGRIVVTAARKHGARGFGVDLNPVRIGEANDNARKAGVTDKVAFYQRDLFETDLSEATVITMYLLPRVNMQLRPKLLDLRPGTRLVSHDFSMEDWTPDEHVQMEANDKYGGAGGKSDIYLWVVPAKTAGRWQWQLQVAGKPQTYEIALDQKFQVISGTVRAAGRSANLENARLRGDQISFSFTLEINGDRIRHDFSGKANGDAVSGNAILAGRRVQSRLEWNARRSAANAGVSRPSVTALLAEVTQ